MRAGIIFFFFLSYFALPAGAQLFTALLNGNTTIAQHRIYISVADSFQLIRKPEAECSRWYEIKSVIREYDNLISKNGLYRSEIFDTISYVFHHLPQVDTLPHPGLGTHYYCLLAEVPGRDTFSYYKPLWLHDKLNIVQVVCRKNDTYLGYLQEQWHNPFIIPPRRIAGINQADACVGADCASFAIYGMRRLGYAIPFCGPKGIYNYLTALDSQYISYAEGKILRDNGQPVPTSGANLRPGDIVHFGGQVSVFYEDRGIFGQLDGDDLLIECYTAGPHIVPLRESAFSNRPFRLYRWQQPIYKADTHEPHH